MNQNLENDPPLSSVTILNLSNDEEMLFVGLDPKEALVSAYIVENGLTSRLHDQAYRDQLKARIVEGKTSYGLDDYAAIKPDAPSSRPRMRS